MQLRSIFIYLSLGFFVPLSSSSDAGFLKQGDFFVPSLSASLSGMTGDFSRLQWHCNDSDDDDDYSGSLLSTCSSFSQLLVKLSKHSFWIVPLFTKSSLIHQKCYKMISGRAHQNQFVGWWLEERRLRRGGWLSAPLIGTRWVIVSIKGWWFLRQNPDITLFANRWWSHQGWLKKWRLRSRPSWWRRRRERSTLRPTFSGFLWGKMIRKMLFFQIVIKQTRTV